MKNISDLKIVELEREISLLYPLCGFGKYANTGIEVFIQHQWKMLSDRLTEKIDG